ncbi:hypothetical protein [Algibacter pectinivorans]|uniref:DUF1566 domain-containing protein n=1 Tax=Algibacter pectinivorans TaxID=870482 RepID=A0A1I1S0P5_9FLAO|nr:hypothetical protein [Algibacter pectinivorans]SFD39882.1 hypothetical protein SAMN04487987_11255 [Algibacter pectinivorans]
MDNVISFFETFTLKEIIITVIGILVSWMVSRYFFYKKKPSKIEDTKRFKETDFGNNRNITKEHDPIDLKSKYFGTWTIYGNGTVKDNTNYITWIRAPWGTIWNGSEFIGDPNQLTWTEASDLFGKGIYVKNPFPTLTLEQRPTIFKKNYTLGNCKVSFANAETWRLPTAAEADTLKFFVPDHLDIDEYKRHQEEAKTLKAQLFPFLTTLSKQSNKYYRLWTADLADLQYAWSFQETTLDDTKMDTPCLVLLVKNN